VPVSTVGKTADIKSQSTDRQGAWTGGGNASTLLRRLLIGLALAAPIGAIAAAAFVWLTPNRAFEPSCSSPVRNAKQGGCVVSVPIRDIAVRFSATVSLSPNGDTLLLGGPLRSDATKVVLARFNIAERRETWRTALDDFGVDVRVAVSANGDKAAVWGVTGIRVLDLPSGTLVITLPAEVLGDSLIFDVAFSEDGDSVVTGDASRRRSFRLAGPASEPVPAPGFDPPGTCLRAGHVGQSNLGSFRSRDGKTAVLLPTAMAGAPVRVGRSGRTNELSEAICATSSVGVLVGPAGWEEVTAVFASFSPKDDRLAVVYSGKPPNGNWRTLIDIWDPRGSMERLASFSIDGSVSYRIGWTHDARRLAAIRSINDSTDALIYEVP
jgi:hypothetical protein